MRHALVLAALLGASAAPAIAQTPATPPAVATPPSIPADATTQANVRARGRELMAACRTDIRAYCSKVEPGGGRIVQCFRQNADKLTPACVATLKAMRGAAATPPTAG